MNRKAILSLLDSDGPLATLIEGYEKRQAQAAMMEDVVDAYENSSVALVEAGTGTGKSVAYLIPAMIWAVKHKVRTVISTHTITLQEQLLNKDIPFLLKALNIDLKAVLVKGMGNYLCLRKFEDIYAEKKLLSFAEQEEIEKIAFWKENTKEGSRSSLPIMPSSALWNEIGADSDACQHMECPFYKDCFFFKARKEAQDAQILVVNHHLLCADLMKKKESVNDQGALLPNYRHAIIDEAHHLEEVATEYFADRIIQRDIVKLLSRLISEKKEPGKLSKLRFLETKLRELPEAHRDPNIATCLNYIEMDLPVAKQNVLTLLFDFFDAFYLFACHCIKSLSQEDDSEEMKCRLFLEHFMHEDWKQSVYPKYHQLLAEMKGLVQLLVSLEKEIQALDLEKLNEKTKSTRIDILGIMSRLQKMTVDFEKFCHLEGFEDEVRWLEVKKSRYGSSMQLVRAALNISQMLQDLLFEPLSCIILCSATLTTGRSFAFMKERIGLQQVTKKIIEKCYESPFDYPKQALLVVPKDLPPPTDQKFTQKASEVIWDALQASQGQAFILFTSFQMLKLCHEFLESRLKTARFPIFIQGQASRQVILDQFRKSKHAVLFGTDSFWEGVDIVGDTLRCVIITKLPFKVPTEPIIQARSEKLHREGKDPFMDYSIPNAIVKFKQGFGRLIRNRQDRGCVICLDSRLVHKAYGKLFLQSLPSCTTFFENSDLIQEKMKAFYMKKFPS